MGEHSTITLIINFALTFKHNHRLYPPSRRGDGNSYSDTFAVISGRAHVDIAHANSIDGPTTIHRMPDWSLIHVDDVVRMPTSIGHARADVVKKLESLNLNFVRVSLCLVSDDTVGKVVLG